MSAGKLRERVYFERLNSSSDEYGNQSDGWVQFPDEGSKYWADIRERTGKETLEAGSINAPRFATVRIRKCLATSGLTEADRLIARGRTWNIRSIAQPDQKGKMLELLVEAGVAV